MATAGDGCYIIDDQGKRYFDGCGGAAVSCLGHSNTRVTEAIKNQLDQLAYAHTGFFTSQAAETLADLLITHAPKGIDRAYFVSGGSEAVETALKLARQYWVEKGETQRQHLIARRQSYHGNTLGALAVGGNEWRRQQFAPLLINVSHIAPCYEYAERLPSESEFDYGQRTAQELEQDILRLGAENVIGFLAEPVVGATLGAVAAVDGYYTRIRDICDKYGILLILDEVMCGMGRTGHLFACEADNITADIICIAKGMGAGYQPVGATLCTDEIYSTIQNGSGFFQHGHTYIGHPAAMAAGVAVVSEIIENNLVDDVKTKGAYFGNALASAFEQHPNVGDVRGRGLFYGLEFVANKETKQPFGSDTGFSSVLKKTALNGGLVCYTMPGTRDGKEGDHVLLAPPFIATEEQLDEVVEKLSLALDATLNSIHS